MRTVLLLLLLLCVSSVYSTALFDYFNGVDVVEGHVYVDYSPFTVTAWVNPRQYGYGMVVSIDTWTLEPQFRLELHTDGHVAFYFDGIDVHPNVPGSPDPSGWVSPLATASPVPLNTYTHVAAVRNGLNFFLYVNGKITSTTVGLYHANFTTPVPLRVGSRHTLGTKEAFNPFRGGQLYSPSDVHYEFKLMQNEVITGAVVQFDEFLQSIRFITSLGRTSQFYGKDRGTTGYIILPPGTGFSGFFGTQGWSIDSIGLNYIYINDFSAPVMSAASKNSTIVGDIKVQPSVVV